MLIEDQVIIDKPVNVWVEVHAGNSFCQSNKKSVTLHHTGAVALLTIPQVSKFFHK